MTNEERDKLNREIGELADSVSRTMDACGPAIGGFVAQLMAHEGEAMPPPSWETLRLLHKLSVAQMEFATASGKMAQLLADSVSKLDERLERLERGGPQFSPELRLPTLTIPEV